SGGLADTLLASKQAEAVAGVESQAGGVLREDAGVDGPNAGGLGGRDERGQQTAADAAAARFRGDVDGVFDDARIAGTFRDGGGHDVAEDRAVVLVDGDEAVIRELG